MTLRIGLELLFIGRVRPSKRTFVIDCPEYGRLCAIPRDVSEARDNSATRVITHLPLGST